MTARINEPSVSVPWLPDYSRQVEREIDRSRELEAYTVATLPDPGPPFRWIHVSDEAGGPTSAQNNGTNWLRFPDGAVVS